jgi:hypothetical protein
MIQNMKYLKIYSFYLKLSLTLLVFNEIWRQNIYLLCRISQCIASQQWSFSAGREHEGFFRMLEAVIRAV